MARNVRSAFRKIPKETSEALRKTKRFTSTVALKKIEEMEAPIATPLRDIKEMAKREAAKHNVKITISKDMAYNPNADGVCIQAENTIRLHPILKYYDKTYVDDVIKHEIDHIQAYRKLGYPTGGRGRHPKRKERATTSGLFSFK